MKNIVVGLLAHVDAGKTTLAEALLCQSGALRNPGRVDHGNTLMDTHELEKTRGITIFTGEAQLPLKNMTITLLDTPGHVDFSAEMERTLSVLDAAILVISGTDGIQPHTATLWRLLGHYHIPVFIFITKMDFARRTSEALITELQREFGDGCVNFSTTLFENPDSLEQLAFCREDLLEAYLESGEIPEANIRECIAERLIFPCFFGSGLKMQGIEAFLNSLEKWLPDPIYSTTFGARVFRITHDARGERLTHLKLTGGTLNVRDVLSYKIYKEDAPGDTTKLQEKISGIRIVNGAKFTPVQMVIPGMVCAVSGLSAVVAGQGLGFEAAAAPPVLEPVMEYQVSLPPGSDPKVVLPKLKILETEDPLLQFSWLPRQQEIHVAIMGSIQKEILERLIADRFDLNIQITAGKVRYRETIDAPVIGVGHYEPLRHYAEVHLLLEPLPRGSGIRLTAQVSEDVLDRNWQRLILTHLAERTHLGVLIGAPITDIKITLIAGRAHLKHTEGGDFRQATYRALRQGLMQAREQGYCRILEPYDHYRLEVPAASLGRAMTDLRSRHAEMNSPDSDGIVARITGKAPVICLSDYATQVASYTGGKGRLNLEVCGSYDCHNPEAIIEAFNYNPEADLEHSPDSIFCAHGGGFSVNWKDVPKFMHLESHLPNASSQITSASKRKISISDREMAAIMAREFGPPKQPTLYRPPEKITEDSISDGKKNNNAAKYYLIDGYNVIFSWTDLKEMAKTDLSGARDHIIAILCNFAAINQCEVILVFDGHKMPGNRGEKFDFQGIHIVYTRENESADLYIERLINEIGKNEQVRVITSDGLIQLSAVRKGILRMSAREFEGKISKNRVQINKILDDLHRNANHRPLKELLE